ncbi:hypothetical protein CMO92_01985 [Candidatus Woesearchaeota archaeon]|nr:hypothetical protein [Candidatus Woesearchaeota archaeon]|tara:strand:- start:726 stop:1298 length:573 start_codon:yes stop_codon:yes gene_type:complete
MIQNIGNCKRCDLYKNQRPILDTVKTGDVMWVGISAKETESSIHNRPLAENTITGKIIHRIEDLNPQLIFYKTNLVKCLPLNNKLKIRYPETSEKECCYPNFQQELIEINPKIIFLLGKKTAMFILSKYSKKITKFNTDFKYVAYKHKQFTFIPIHHPAYMYKYKQKTIPIYINSISSIMRGITTNVRRK